VSERYEYALSLRIGQPSMSPGAITRRIRLKPQFTWAAGSPRRTPRGAPLRSADGRFLGGVRRDSYWSAHIVRYRVGRCGRPLAAEILIEKFCRRLVRHAEFFKRIWDECGHVWLWVDSHSGLNYTFTLSPDCIGLLAAAGVMLVIDVYPYPQNFGRQSPRRRSPRAAPALPPHRRAASLRATLGEREP